MGDKKKNDDLSGKLPNQYLKVVQKENVKQEQTIISTRKLKPIDVQCDHEGEFHNKNLTYFVAPKVENEVRNSRRFSLVSLGENTLIKAMQRLASSPSGASSEVWCIESYASCWQPIFSKSINRKSAKHQHSHKKTARRRSKQVEILKKSCDLTIDDLFYSNKYSSAGSHTVNSSPVHKSSSYSGAIYSLESASSLSLQTCQDTNNNNYIKFKNHTNFSSAAPKIYICDSFVREHPTLKEQQSVEKVDHYDSYQSHRLECKKVEEENSRGSEQINFQDPNTDQGYAWVILVAMFIINASTLGSYRAYCLIFERLARSGEQSRTDASLPFTIMGAVENMAGPIAGYMVCRLSWRLTIFVGSFLITSAHLIAALFSSSRVALIISMGLINGFGLSLVSISSFKLNNAYFVKYRSTAFGFSLSGAVLGAFYISPSCQYILNRYNGNTQACYLLMSALLAPNIPLALLLRPKESPYILSQRNSIESNIEELGYESSDEQDQQRSQTAKNDIKLWPIIVEVFREPMFHLIWPMQLIYCWLNFVYGTIIIDFGRDKGLESQVADSLPIFWALGQLVGRVALSSLVDITSKVLTLKRLTALSLLILATLTVAMIHVEPNSSTANFKVSTLTFLLSVFIANQYILFNGLVVRYLPPSMTMMAIGLSSFIGSFLLLPRAFIIGYYRDSNGTYDTMLTMFSYVLVTTSMMWLMLPKMFKIYKSIS